MKNIKKYTEFLKEEKSQVKESLNKKINEDVKYPNIEVELIGQDGNAFAIMGRVKTALRRAGVSKEEIKLFLDEATSGDYDNLLQTVMQWVSVDIQHED